MCNNYQLPRCCYDRNNSVVLITGSTMSVQTAGRPGEERHHRPRGQQHPAHPHQQRGEGAQEHVPLIKTISKTENRNGKQGKLWLKSISIICCATFCSQLSRATLANARIQGRHSMS